MKPSIIDLKDKLNERLFDYDLLEYRHGLNEMDRLAIRKECNNEKFRDNHLYDDLYTIGENNALFTDRAIRFISEISKDMGLTVKFHYRQCFTIGEV